jgi:molecular chaperone GrpE
MKHTKPEHQTTETKAPEVEATVDASVNQEASLPETDAQTEASELDSTAKALSELQTKYDQLNDQHLRTLAEFDNYRKRSLREKADLIKSGGENVLVSVLTVVDDMERGLLAMKETQDVEAVKEGMELIYNKFLSFLKQHHVVAIETEGKDFDTDHHEAITTFPAPSEALKGKVVDCVQKGYLLNDKVIRFAKVVVGE